MNHAVSSLSAAAFILVMLAAAVGAAADQPAETAATAAPPPGAPIVISPNRSDVSPPLRDIEPRPVSKQRFIRMTHDTPPATGRPADWQGKVGVRYSPHVEQTSMPKSGALVSPTINVEGLGEGTPNFFVSGAPPDTTGAVGAGYFVQWVNTSYAFYSTDDGSLVNLPGVDWRAGNVLFSGMGGPCETTNDGDPVVLYDQLADRWMMSQFAVPNYPNPPFYQCIAVSVSNDPLGSWYRYEYTWPGNKFNDYPKLSMWPDGYYMTANEFSSGVGIGAAVAVFERSKMLVGGVPQVLYWDLPAGYYNLLPVDLDGMTPPPAGSPGYALGAQAPGLSDTIDIWEIAVDWVVPTNSTCGDAANHPTSAVPVTNWNAAADVSQPVTSEELDSIGNRLMFRAPYRNFGTHESIVLNHSCCVRPSKIRWYEIRDPGGATPVLYQEGTFAPDGDGRWMGSIAQDGAGNMLLGYSVSGTSTYPSIRVAGRLAGDPLGQLTIGEIEIATGSGYQLPPIGSTRNRWGDYSTMAVDPTDDCTFWYTQEYLVQSGRFVWQTRIAALELPGCIPADAIFVDMFESGDTSAWSSSVP